MTRIAIELDLPSALAEAAEKQGLLSSLALSELISRELRNTPPAAKIFNPADYPPGFQAWMVNIVPPDLLGSVSQNCSDEELMEPIDADWYAARGSWGPGLEDDDDNK